MTKSFLLTLLLISYLSAASQTVKMKSSISVSIPVIYNNSEASYYQLGGAKFRRGKAASYGLNIAYSHALYDGVYGKLGVGYFKQSFGIIRPFRYESSLDLLYSTNSYHYDNVQLFCGIGYKLILKKWILLNGNITYNQYYSYRQKYINHSPVPSQVNHKSLSLGRMINLEFGEERRISKKVSIETNIVFPVFTNWNNDEIFINNYYSSDEQQIARNKFSAGITVSCNYNF
jgi:hypothetical protein